MIIDQMPVRCNRATQRLFREMAAQAGLNQFEYFQLLVEVEAQRPTVIIGPIVTRDGDFNVTELRKALNL